LPSSDGIAKRGDNFPCGEVEDESREDGDRQGGQRLAEHRQEDQREAEALRGRRLDVECGEELDEAADSRDPPVDAAGGLVSTSSSSPSTIVITYA